MLVKIRKLFCLLIFFYHIINCFAAIAESEEIEIEAENIWFNIQEQRVIAEGKVTVQNNSNILTADKIMYDKILKRLTVVGNVDAQQSKKYGIHGTKAFLDCSNGRGYVIKFSARIKNKIFLTGERADIVEGNKFFAKNIIFTTCTICKNNILPNKPLWQVEASLVRINIAEKSMWLNNSTIRLLDFPLLYLPFLKLPLPGSKRARGFSFPSLQYSEALGIHAKLRYFFDLSPHTKLIYSSVINAKGNKEQRLDCLNSAEHSYNSFESHFIKSTDNKYDGLINVKGDFYLLNNIFIKYWLGYLFYRDELILSRFNFFEEKTIKSYIQFSDTPNDNFYSLQLLHFQNLLNKEGEIAYRANDCFIVPWFQVEHDLSYKLLFFDDVTLTGDTYKLYHDQQPIIHLQLEAVKSLLIKNIKFNIVPTATFNSIVASQDGVAVNTKLHLNALWPVAKTFSNKAIMFEPFTSLTLGHGTIKKDLTYTKVMTNVSSFGHQKTNLNIEYGLRTQYDTKKSIFGTFLSRRHGDVLSNISDLEGKIYFYIKEGITLTNSSTINNSHGIYTIDNELDATLQRESIKLSFNHLSSKKEFALNALVNFYQNWWANLQAKTIKDEHGQKSVMKHLSFIYEGDCLKLEFGVKNDHLKPGSLKKNIVSFLQIEPLLKR